MKLRFIAEFISLVTKIKTENWKKCKIISFLVNNVLTYSVTNIIKQTYSHRYTSYTNTRGHTCTQKALRNLSIYLSIYLSMPSSFSLSLYIYICIYIYMCVCVCVCL